MRDDPADPSADAVSSPLSSETTSGFGGMHSGRFVHIMAHPGHELLLHHWMERTRPVVVALTDGSAARGVDRRASSERTIRLAGAEVGPFFGAASDRDWYDAILAGDLRPFRRTSERIAQLCIERDIAMLMVDPVEFFNPVHDLCAAIGQHVAFTLKRQGASPRLFDYEIEQRGARRVAPKWTLGLDAGAIDRKLAAAAQYRELAEEVERVRRKSDPAVYSVERIFEVDPGALWPLTLDAEPFYEHVGRQRVANGTYRQLITYQDHVRPLAVALAGGSTSVS
jgi:hypothetical protein